MGGTRTSGWVGGWVKVGGLGGGLSVTNRYTPQGVRGYFGAVRMSEIIGGVEVLQSVTLRFMRSRMPKKGSR
jgi:hypothetical protein